jgi:hypothetical protein
VSQNALVVRPPAAQAETVTAPAAGAAEGLAVNTVRTWHIDLTDVGTVTWGAGDDGVTKQIVTQHGTIDVTCVYNGATGATINSTGAFFTGGNNASFSFDLGDLDPAWTAADGIHECMVEVASSANPGAWAFAWGQDASNRAFATRSETAQNVVAGSQILGGFAANVTQAGIASPVLRMSSVLHGSRHKIWHDDVGGDGFSGDGTLRNGPSQGHADAGSAGASNYFSAAGGGRLLLFWNNIAGSSAKFTDIYLRHLTAEAGELQLP